MPPMQTRPAPTRLVTVWTDASEGRAERRREAVDQRLSAAGFGVVFALCVAYFGHVGRKEPPAAW